MGNKDYLEVSPKIISIHFPHITPTVVGVILTSTSACFAVRDFFTLHVISS